MNKRLEDMTVEEIKRYVASEVDYYLKYGNSMELIIVNIEPVYVPRYLTPEQFKQAITEY